MYPSDIAQAHRHARIARRQRNLAKILRRLQITRGAYHVFGLAEFEHRAARLLVGPVHRVDHLLLGDVECSQPIGVEHDLILLDHAAQGGDFGHVDDRLQFVLQEPILQGTQLRQIQCVAAIDERVLKHPAHTRSVRTECGLGLRRQARLHLIQIFEHSRARPVRIGPVLKKDVDEGIAKHRITAHRLGTRHGQHGRRERVGHLVLDDLGSLAGKGCANDDLHVRQVRDGIERCPQHRPQAPCRNHPGHQQHEKAVGDRPADEPGNHGCRCGAAGAAGTPVAIELPD